MKVISSKHEAISKESVFRLCRLNQFFFLNLKYLIERMVDFSQIGNDIIFCVSVFIFVTDQSFHNKYLDQGKSKYILLYILFSGWGTYQVWHQTLCLVFVNQLERRNGIWFNQVIFLKALHSCMLYKSEGCQLDFRCTNGFTNKSCMPVTALVIANYST